VKCAKKLSRAVLTSGTSNSPALILSMRSCGCEPSTVHPTDWHVPDISTATACQLQLQKRARRKINKPLANL